MRLLLVPFLALLSACAAQPRLSHLQGAQVISPAVAVLAAADAAPGGFRGRFGFVVQRAEWVGPRLFLNSHPDYRDQRNLSVAIHPVAVRRLQAVYGSDLRRAFRHRQIVVDGMARRVRINFTVNGRPSGKYYFQTHVVVTGPRQIFVVVS